MFFQQDSIGEPLRRRLRIGLSPRELEADAKAEVERASPSVEPSGGLLGNCRSFNAIACRNSRRKNESSTFVVAGHCFPNFPNAETQLPVAFTPDTLGGDMTDPQSQHDRRKRGPWLFVATAFLLLVAVAFSLLLPYYQQRQVLVGIERRGGRVQVVHVGPEWLHGWLPSVFCRVYSVDVADMELSDDHLASISAVCDPQELYLQQTQVGDAGLQHLTHMLNLRVLWLDGTSITDAGLKHLISLPTLKNLRLDGTQITDEGLEHLPSLSNLAELSLNQTGIHGAGLKHVASLPELERIELNQTQLDDASLRHLSGLRNLTILSLEGTAISDAGLEHLSSSSSLKFLYLADTQVTPAGVKKLHAALPDCQIDY